uniref:Uncharacterized protein n=1 Tax=Steinernema glaseri TaxID=37863 RepID=A0A1I7YQ98_9BILA
MVADDASLAAPSSVITETTTRPHTHLSMPYRQRMSEILLNNPREHGLFPITSDRHWRSIGEIQRAPSIVRESERIAELLAESSYTKPTNGGTYRLLNVFSCFASPHEDEGSRSDEGSVRADAALEVGEGTGDYLEPRSLNARPRI